MIANNSSPMSAVVTGGGSGLGREICLLLAKKKAKILVADIHLSDAENTVKDALSEGATEAQAILCDVRRVEDIQKMADIAYSFMGRVDLLVNNAGVAAAGQFSSLSLEDWKWIVDTNLWGVIHGCHVFLPRMQNQSSLGDSKGKILNIASAAGLLSPPEMAGYNVTKAGVIALSETLYAEKNKTGIGITVACPMFFASSLISNARIQDPEVLGFAHQMVSYSRSPAVEVAKGCLSAVERDRLYAMPSAEGRVMWRLKRFSPELFSKVAITFESQWKRWALRNSNPGSGNEVNAK